MTSLPHLSKIYPELALTVLQTQEASQSQARPENPGLSPFSESHSPTSIRNVRQSSMTNAKTSLKCQDKQDTSS